MFGLRLQPTFEVTHDPEPSRTLLAGLSAFGLAGLTAVDYLVDQLGLEEVGHITVDQLPAITPFEEGTPRHHTRLFTRDDLEFTVLVGDLFVPAWAAEPFTEDVLGWADGEPIEEAVVLSGVPVAHGPDDHRTFYVASRDYQREHLQEYPRPGPGAGLPEDPAVPVPMPGGFLDGVNGAIMSHAVDSPLRACVYTTPAHGQAPDVEAALRLLGVINHVYDIGIDTGPLEAFAAEVGNYYEELTARMEAARVEDAGHEDRMYM